MKTHIITFYAILIVMHLSFLQLCHGASFFEMALQSNSVYTPGGINLSLRLTEKAKIENDYKFQISVYVADILVRKQIMPALKTKPVVFELTFPESSGKIDGRCRVELFINGDFIEAEEEPLTLRPLPSPYIREPKTKVIWVYDTSGQLQKAFSDFKVEITDATFQSARNFGKPNIVFIGQNLDANSMQIITDRLMLDENKPLIVFLQQKRLSKYGKIVLPKENNRSSHVACDFNSVLLAGLNKYEIMHLVDNASYVEIKIEKDLAVNSSVTEAIKSKDNVYSYLAVVQDSNQAELYCQLPVADIADPRQNILLRNLLKFADEVSVNQNSQPNKDN